MLEFLRGWVASSNFRLLVLLFLVFCEKNAGLVAIVLVTVAERKHKPGATAFVLHHLNKTALNLLVGIESSLQKDFPHFSGLVESHYKYFFQHQRKEWDFLLLFSVSNHLSSATDTNSPNVTEQHVASITKRGSQERHFIYAHSFK